MTLVELLVASTLGLLVLGMTMTSTISNRNTYGYDLARTRLNQNLRSALDIISTEIRQAGERLPSGFPAIEIVDGGAGSDKIILRRNLLDEVLTVCQTITAATSTGNVFLSSTAAGAPPACVYGSQAANYASWHNYRLTKGDASHKVQVYIYDLAAKAGEFFYYNSESDNSGTQVQSIHNQSAFHNNYSSSSTAAYALVEWTFQLSAAAGQADLLQLIENGDTANARNVVYGVNKLTFRALMQDGTVKTTFTKNDAWSLIQAIEITISGQDTYRGRPITSSLTTQLFPRNILSN